MKVLWLILLGLFVAPSAFGQSVKYTFDTKAEFSKFKTYRWEKHPTSIEVDAVTLSQLGAAFDAELAKKGLTRSKSDKADLVIVYQIAINVDEEVTYFRSGWDVRPTWGATWFTDERSISTSTTGKEMIAVGSIDLDIYESAEQKLIWRGIVSKSLEAGATDEKRKKTFALIASKLIKNYPPNKK